MAQKNPTPLVYDDPKLAVIAQQVILAKPWTTQPTPTDFPALTTPRMQVPQLTWIIEDTEERWREKLTQYLNNVLGDDFTIPIRDLPGNYISAIIANLFYNSRAYIDCVFPPRLDEELIAHPYAAPAYWIGYYLCDMFIEEISKAGEKIKDGAYRMKQLGDLRKIFGFMMNATLTDYPVIRPSNQVIVAATKNTAQRNVVYVDAGNLEKYFDNGGTIDQLTTEWFMEGKNPTV